MPKLNWSLVAEENGITVRAAQGRWFRFKANAKEGDSGPVPKQDSEPSFGIPRTKKRKRGYISGDDDSTSGESSRKLLVKQEIKVERGLEKHAQGGREEAQTEAQETSTPIVIKIEKDAYDYE